MPIRPAPLRALATLVVLAGLAPLAACRDVAPAFGTARSADGGSPGVVMFESFRDRFTDVKRNAKYDAARMRLAKGALLPSRVFDDTAAWLSRPSEAVRFINFHGYTRPEGYRIDAKPLVPIPARVGDARHTVVLSRLSDDEYRWDIGVDYAVGTVTPVQAAEMFRRWFGALESAPAPIVRAASRAAFPRSHAALGKLFSWDSLATRTLDDGSVAATITLGVHPERLRATLPAFAGFAAKYTTPTTINLAIQDRSGAPWLDIRAAKNVMTVRLRSKGGRLLPLSGAARVMPDSMQMRLDFLTKVKVFGVGYRDLVTDFVVVTNATEASWTWTARREPKWELPLATARLIRTPLRRPFQGSGSSFRVGYFAPGGGPTLMRREMHLTVQESAILRFFGGLGAAAFGDFEGAADREQDVFLREVFGAIAGDLRALGAGDGKEE